MCLGGGIGRRGGLENQCPEKRAGSNPVRDTTSLKTQKAKSSPVPHRRDRVGQGSWIIDTLDATHMRTPELD